MSVSPVTYEDFQTAKQAFVADGGVWVPSNDVTTAPGITVFSSLQEDYCDGYCLECKIIGTVQNPTYEFTYITNISVEMSQYGLLTALDFTWTYWLVYTTKDITTAPSIQIPMRSQVNEIIFDDVTVARDTAAFNADHTWVGSLISHSATISVSPIDGRAFLAISIIYDTIPDTALNMDTYVKDISFKLTTPTFQSVSSGASSSGSLTSGTSPSVASGSLPTSSSQSSQASKIPTGAFGGIAAGVVVLIAVFVTALVLYRRRKQVGHPSSEEYEPTPAIFPHKKQGRPGSSTVLSTSNNNQVVTAPTSISQHHQQQTRPETSSERMLNSPDTTSGIQEAVASTVIDDPPPAYGDEELPP